MLLTIEQRREAYKAVLENTIKARPNRTGWICCNLDDYAKCKEWSITRKTDKDFPEFYAQKPVDAEDADGWWLFDEEGKQSRIKALQKAIELTYADYPCDSVVKQKIVHKKKWWQIWKR